MLTVCQEACKRSVGTVAAKPHAALAKGTIFLPAFWSRKQRLGLLTNQVTLLLSDGAGFIHLTDITKLLLYASLSSRDWGYIKK